jgi:small subunit ribosomal protein S8
MGVLSDPLSDFLTRFKNASRAKNDQFTAPFSKAKAEIARILKEEGYIWDYEVDTSGQWPVLHVTTKFVDGTPALTDLKKVSKPGRRQYVGAQEIPRVLNGLGISIVSTSKGLMSGSQAKRRNMGGELLALVW